MASFVNPIFKYSSWVVPVNSCEVVASHVSRLLREAREKNYLSLNELSARAGLSRQMVSYIEQEKRNPSLDVLLRLSWALKINLDDIIREARIAASRESGAKSKTD